MFIIVSTAGPMTGRTPKKNLGGKISRLQEDMRRCEIVSIRFCMVIGAKWVSKFETLLGGSKAVDGSTMLDLILLILLTKNDKCNSQSLVEVAEIAGAGCTS